MEGGEHGGQPGLLDLAAPGDAVDVVSGRLEGESTDRSAGRGHQGYTVSVCRQRFLH